jgi:hypothetical protein
LKIFRSAHIRGAIVSNYLAETAREASAFRFLEKGFVAHSDDTNPTRK